MALNSENLPKWQKRSLLPEAPPWRYESSENANFTGALLKPWTIVTKVRKLRHTSSSKFRHVIYDVYIDGSMH